MHTWLSKLVEVPADITTAAVWWVPASMSPCTSQVPNQGIGFALCGCKDQRPPACTRIGPAGSRLAWPRAAWPSERSCWTALQTASARGLASLCRAVPNLSCQHPQKACTVNSSTLITAQATNEDFRKWVELMLLLRHTRLIRPSTLTKFCAPRPRHSSTTSPENSKCRLLDQLPRVFLWAPIIGP